MGRKKVELKKIERNDYRHICFGKRKNGLVKKAYELSTLCDVEVALIIFSEAGKLILFDGKKRVEEIIKRYIDFPNHEFGRVPNEERIRRLVDQMTVEANSYHRENSSSARNIRMAVETQLERIQNQISLGHVQLDEVEKQLEYFMPSSNCMEKSIDEIECHETVLIEALKRVSLHRQVLEEKVNSKVASKTLHPQTANASGFMMEGSPKYGLGWPQQQTANASRLMMGSPKYGLGWPQQQDHTQILTTNLANPTGFQSLRYVVGNGVSGNSDQLRSAVVFRSAGFLTGNAEKTTHITAGPSQAVSDDDAEDHHGSSITPPMTF